MLRFVVALEPEARPLIERYRLERLGEPGAFKIFRRRDVALVVSGVGDIADYSHRAEASAVDDARTGVVEVAIEDQVIALGGTR